jgi:imidazolonepropionase-like amidohydrolase
LDAGWLVKLGASEERALAACTSLAAEAAQQADIGKIASGCRADLLAVRGNPLKDIHDLQKVSLVMKAGQLVELSAA